MKKTTKRDKTRRRKMKDGTKAKTTKTLSLIWKEKKRPVSS